MERRSRRRQWPKLLSARYRGAADGPVDGPEERQPTEGTRSAPPINRLCRPVLVVFYARPEIVRAAGALNPPPDEECTRCRRAWCRGGQAAVGLSQRTAGSPHTTPTGSGHGAGHPFYLTAVTCSSRGVP